jgi:hypothetical protein
MINLSWILGTSILERSSGYSHTAIRDGHRQRYKLVLLIVSVRNVFTRESMHHATSSVVDIDDVG